MARLKRGAKQKPMPTSATQRATPTGPRSTTTPRASNTSAVPTEDEAARLPCLHTATPAPAVIMAAKVVTLKLRKRSPPVPTKSTTSPSVATVSVCASMARTNPVTSATDSPLARRATNKAAVWAGVASPSKTCSITHSASVTSREPPSNRRLRTPGHPPSASNGRGVPDEWWGST
jgi:hypothetical protein